MMACLTEEKRQNLTDNQALKWKSPHGRILPQAHSGPLVMGILNMTPNSFSNDGLAGREAQALDYVDHMIRDGADIIDIGGFPTRPPFSEKIETQLKSARSTTLPQHSSSAYEVSLDEELGRVLPTLKAIRAKYPDLPISVDTTRHQIAREAIQAGADIINDQKALCEGVDPNDLQRIQQAFLEGKLASDIPLSPMAKTIAELRCPVILMHHRSETHYEDFWAELFADFRCFLSLARQAGIAQTQIWLDPGFCFGKEPKHNLEVVKNIHKIHDLKAPIVLGTSRKSTIGKVLDSPIDQRIPGTIATTLVAHMQGVQMVRVHDVRANRQAIQMMHAIQQGLNFNG